MGGIARTVKVVVVDAAASASFIANTNNRKQKEMRMKEVMTHHDVGRIGDLSAPRAYASAKGEAESPPTSRSWSMSKMARTWNTRWTGVGDE